MVNRINTKIKSFFALNILPLLFLALALRVLVSPFGTLDLDFNTFVAWSRKLAQHGFASFYNGWSDYLPGYLYVLWILGIIREVFTTIPPVLLYKLPAILADVATGFVIYKVLKNFKNEKMALLGSFFYLFNPAVIANSSLWGQVDSFVALCAMLVVYFVRTKYALSAFFLAVGTLMKPHTAFVAPLVGLIMLRDKWHADKIIKYLSISATLFVVAFLPFLQGSNIFEFILKRLQTSLGQYQYTSVNAFNFWSFGGFWQKDTLAFQATGYVFVVFLFGFFALKLWKRAGWEYMLMSILFLSTFLFTTRMHERHLLAVFAPLSVISILDFYILAVLAIVSVTYIANLRYSYIWITESFRTIFSDNLVKVISAVNIASFTLLLMLMLRKTKKSINQVVKKIRMPADLKSSGQERFSAVKISRNKIRYLLILVLFFTFFTRVYSLTAPKTEYFDEVYHAFTARRMLHGDPKAWEWWNTPPEGFAYEWTHPPLAKYGMVLGMLVFGENSFGWRFPGAVMGVVAVFLLYLVAKEIFKDELLAVLSAFIFSLDGIFLVISRIGMNDVYFLAFALLSIYLFLKNKYMFSALALGLSLSAKWSALWVYPVLILGQALLGKKKTKSFLLYFLIPPLVYLAVYIPFFISGHTFEQFINIDALVNCVGISPCRYPFGLQQQMFWYHTHLNATHAYSSPWWSWPLNIRPVYLYTSAEINNMVARIYLIDNPMLSWVGALGIIVLTTGFVRSKLKNLNTQVLFILGSYFIFFIPWALSPRIMFLYHYLPSLPFLAIVVAYVVRKHPKLMFIIFPLFLIAFIYFYPHWTGLNVPEWLDKSYYWFSSWR